MIRITEEIVFELIDGSLPDETKSEVLRELPKHPELEKLYRMLLMTEGYIRSHKTDKTSAEFTDIVSHMVQTMINQKKRNGILYRALTFVGIFTVLSIAGTIWLMGTTQVDAGGATQIIQLTDQISRAMSFLDSAAVRNIMIVVVSFTFFVIMDRLLLRHYQMKH